MAEEGELIVGMCLRVNETCDVVVYNHAFPAVGRAGMGEVDVLGLKLKDRVMHLCEVATHLEGLNYGISREDTVARVEKKVRNNEVMATEMAPDWRRIHEFWTPVLGPAVEKDLQEVAARLAADGLSFRVVANERFAQEVARAGERARTMAKRTGDPAFRMLQILTQLAMPWCPPCPAPPPEPGSSGSAATVARSAPARGDDAVEHVTRLLRDAGYGNVAVEGRSIRARGPDGAMRATVRQSSHSADRDSWAFTFRLEEDGISASDSGHWLVGVLRSRADSGGFERKALWIPAAEAVAKFVNTERWRRGDHRLDFTVFDRAGTQWYPHLQDGPPLRENAAPQAPAGDGTKRFHQAMLDLYRRTKAETGYNATRFLAMIGDQGGLEAARILLQGDGVSDGFTELYMKGRLDLTVEALVIRPEWRGLFSEVETAAARRRLERVGYNPSAE